MNRVYLFFLGEKAWRQRVTLVQSALGKEELRRKVREGTLAWYRVSLPEEIGIAAYLLQHMHADRSNIRFFGEISDSRFEPIRVAAPHLLAAPAA